MSERKVRESDLPFQKIRNPYKNKPKGESFAKRAAKTAVGAVIDPVGTIAGAVTNAAIDKVWKD